MSREAVDPARRSAATAERIVRAREHYDTRRERRTRQVWIDHESWDHSTFAAPKGSKGAVPARMGWDLAKEGA